MRTRELAQSVGELRALGEVTQAVNSTVDLETVLTTIVAKATQLSNTEARRNLRIRRADQEFQLRATYGLDDTVVAELRDRHIRIGKTAIGRAVERRIPIQIPDIQKDQSAVLDIIVRAGFRALLIVPSSVPSGSIGALVVRRKEPGEFSKSTTELLQTFAAQSVLAIQNARLFENVEARTRELAMSLEDLRTTQDRLVQTQKLASLGQLTAGIAHEIKNPLNFVNNFSAVSVELIDELREALSGAHLDSKLRAEISEIADTLQGNLDKVVQHGKRADAIVKNMLLHSREGSGEHRFVDINAIVEESLNLAYHGARAEKQGFNITLERSLDPTAGEVDVLPQDITRVLLNLISNGFYAATKRRAETNGGDYEPTLAAATKNLGDRVEIRIRDNGAGILPDVKDKMFNPFFTTKPAGEGTGLASPSVTTSSSSNMAARSRSILSRANSPRSGSSCRALLRPSEVGPMSAFGPKQTWPRAVHMSTFGGKADMTIGTCPLSRSLSGVKQTWLVATHMSACDPKRTSSGRRQQQQTRMGRFAFSRSRSANHMQRYS